MAFNTAISGLNAATTDLNVIGNNIANSSTSGFKASRVQFSDVYPVSNFGVGTNTAGAGVKVDAITQQFTQGNVNFTNSALDLAINGDGFFRLSDNGATVYSRAGAFGLDANGFVSNASGLRLTGYLADPTGNITGALGEMQVSLADLAPSATTTGDVGVNLDATAGIIPGAVVFSTTNPNSYNNATSLNVYDSLGTSHLTTMYFRKTAANDWTVNVTDDATPPNVIGSTTLTFTPAGALSTVNGAALPTSANYTMVTTNGSNNIAFSLDYAQATQFGSPFGVNFLTQNGYTTGRLAGVEIDSTGVLSARYTNGQSLVQGQVVLSNFTNPQGLKPNGDTSWSESSASGIPLTGAPGTSSLGLVQSGALEDSNVNLTEQLVAMITAQRNFQANAQVISTEDAITQTIINMR
jgi:flagellar hook protein FlgE